MDMYASILRSSGNVRAVFIEDSRMPLAKEFETNLRESLAARKIDENDFEILWLNIPDATFDEWTRDYVGLPFFSSELGLEAVVMSPYRSAQATPAVVDRFKYIGIKTQSSSLFMEGGAIMSDSLGRCYYAGKGRFDDLTNYCTEVNSRPSIDFEGTGHIDL